MWYILVTMSALIRTIEQVLLGTLCVKRHNTVVVMDNKHFILSNNKTQIHRDAYHHHLIIHSYTAKTTWLK